MATTPATPHASTDIDTRDPRACIERLREQHEPDAIVRDQTPIYGEWQLEDLAHSSPRLQAELRGATGCSDHRAATLMLEQAARAMPDPGDDPRARRRLEELRLMAAALEPGDAVEGMLAGQMSVAYAIGMRVMEIVSQSGHPDRHPGMRSAIRLLDLGRRQALAYDHIRRGGRQEVRVIREEVRSGRDDEGQETTERRAVEVRGGGGRR